MNSAGSTVSRILISSVNFLAVCLRSRLTVARESTGRQNFVEKTIDGETMHLYISSPPEYRGRR
jgi:hypothetical protein